MIVKKINPYWTSLALCAALYFIWPTIHTIAIRKILLLGGAAVGACILYRSDERKFVLKSPWFVYFILLLVWVIFHAIFLSQNGSEAWKEFVGQWIPPYVALMAGVGCALASRTISPQTFRIFLLVMLLSQSIFYLFFTLIKSVQIGELATGFQNWGITDHKLSLTFYADIAAALACAKIIDVSKVRVTCSDIYPWFLPILLALYVAFFADSLNGFILLGGCILMTIVFIVYLHKNNIPAGAWAIAILLTGVTLYFLATSPFVSAKRDTLLKTTTIAFNIDNYKLKK